MAVQFRSIRFEAAADSPRGPSGLRDQNRRQERRREFQAARTLNFDPARVEPDIGSPSKVHRPMML